MLDTVIIQSPLVQLNTPYPSGAYLSDFFKRQYKERGICGNVKWLDLSNEFFHSVFCARGLKIIFSKTKAKALSMAGRFEKQGDDATAFQLRRFVSLAPLWEKWIDVIVAIVCPGGSSASRVSGREYVHEFIRSAHVPRGDRMEKYLSQLNRDVNSDDAQILASLALADLSDYITLVYDNNFSLIRYAEHIAASAESFSEFESSLNSPMLEDFYKPLLSARLSEYKNKNTIFGISVPFPGCFEAALYTAKFIKTELGGAGDVSESAPSVGEVVRHHLVAFGGGYMNTELREITEPRFFNYCDFVSYDKGYGSFIDIFDRLSALPDIFSEKKELSDLHSVFDGIQFYNTTYLCGTKIVLQKKSDDESCKKISALEHKLVREITPDYSDIDFSNYPRLADDVNPMHRIWNDGSWLKAYIAHGCYWHRCAFCDTTLDYVKDYCLTDVDNLYDRLYEQAKKSGVYGIHFVDEACPPRALEQFAIKNLYRSTSSLALSFWGNIRFEKTFTRDLADILSAGGMTAVSAGIEIATGTGLDAVNKGTDMQNIVFACCAFKEAGILIHSYMIFGFWNQSEQDLIDSMETLRQLFEQGLLDSAFWHKFTLTLHSTVYQEYLKGKYPGLKIKKANENRFAKNDLHYEGEEKSEKYSAPLNTALDLWMHGQKLSKPVETFFPYKMPRPSISKDFVSSLIQKYEIERDKQFSKLPEEKDKFIWLGGDVVVLESMDDGHRTSRGSDGDKRELQLCWSYMGELLYADVGIDRVRAESVCDFLKSISASCGTNVLQTLGKNLFLQLRGKGLCKA